MPIATIGSNNHINVQAIQWFIDEVLPIIRWEIPEASLSVAGAAADSINNQDGVHLLGRVKDLADVYGNAKVIINPMRFGTGLKIKTLEALGHGCPVVTTSIGAEGLEDGSGTALKVADAPKEFAQEVIKLLQDQVAAEKLGNEGLAYIRKVNQEITDRLETITQNGQSQSR